MTDNKNSEKDSSAADSSADRVDEYLQTLGNEDTRERRYYSQEQDFGSEALASIINEARLNELLAQSDAFLHQLTADIESFEDDNN